MNHWCHDNQLLLHFFMLYWGNSLSLEQIIQDLQDSSNTHTSPCRRRNRICCLFVSSSTNRETRWETHISLFNQLKWHQCLKHYIIWWNPNVRDNLSVCGQIGSSLEEWKDDRLVSLSLPRSLPLSFPLSLSPSLHSVAGGPAELHLLLCVVALFFFLRCAPPLCAPGRGEESRSSPIMGSTSTSSSVPAVPPTTPSSSTASSSSASSSSLSAHHFTLRSAAQHLQRSALK